MKEISKAFNRTQSQRLKIKMIWPYSNQSFKDPIIRYSTVATTEPIGKLNWQVLEVSFKRQAEIEQNRDVSFSYLLVISPILRTKFYSEKHINKIFQSCGKKANLHFSFLGGGGQLYLKHPLSLVYFWDLRPLSRATRLGFYSLIQGTAFYNKQELRTYPNADPGFFPFVFFTHDVLDALGFGLG